MKRKILPIVISSVAAMTTQAAFAEIDLYGKINMTMQTVEEESGGVDTMDTIKLNSNASRLGFKGSEDISDAWKAIYKLEYEIYPDSKDSNGGNAFKSRNTYVGLSSSNAGTFLGGQHDTPLKMSQGKVDQFNDLYLGDIKSVISGEVRASNLLAYISPDMSGFGVSVALVSGEDSGAPGDDDNNSIGDGISIAGTFKQDAWYAAVALDQDVGNTDRIRGTVQFSQDAFTVGGIIQTAETNDTNESADTDEFSLLVSGSWTIESWMLKAQLGTATLENNVSGNDEDIGVFLIGADYSLSKTTKLFGYLGNYTAELDNRSNDDEASTIAFGMEHKF